jgi:alkylation response protein AidB-like acyl-CoA dehydrogenase
VITEELLVAGAPVHAHWIADRQSGPLILATGTEEMKRTLLPRIAAGECFVALGLSEPESGSDLASVRPRAHRVEGGWKITGTKLWSSGAQICQYMTVLARTSERDDKNRHDGLSQFLVPLDSPGVTVRGIRDMSGVEHFNESHFEQVFVPEDAVLGQSEKAGSRLPVSWPWNAPARSGCSAPLWFWRRHSCKPPPPP